MGLSLQAYLALTRGLGKTDISAGTDAATEDRNKTGRSPVEEQDGTSSLSPPNSTPEPANPVWMYSEDRETGQALLDLAHRLTQLRPETRIIASGAVGRSSVVTHVDLPQETQRDVDLFSQRFRPKVALVTGRKLRPALLAALAKAGTYLIYIDAQDIAFLHPGPRWLPDPTAATLALFGHVYARDAAATKRLRRLGVPAGKIRQSGQLYPAAHPPETPAAGRDDVASYLAGRPIWLAACLHSDEAPAHS